MLRAYKCSGRTFDTKSVACMKRVEKVDEALEEGNAELGTARRFDSVLQNEMFYFSSARSRCNTSFRSTRKMFAYGSVTYKPTRYGSRARPLLLISYHSHRSIAFSVLTASQSQTSHCRWEIIIRRTTFMSLSDSFWSKRGNWSAGKDPTDKTVLASRCHRRAQWWHFLRDDSCLCDWRKELCVSVESRHLEWYKGTWQRTDSLQKGWQTRQVNLEHRRWRTSLFLAVPFSWPCRTAAYVVESISDELATTSRGSTSVSWAKFSRTSSSYTALHTLVNSIHWGTFALSITATLDRTNPWYCLGPRCWKVVSCTSFADWAPTSVCLNPASLDLVIMWFFCWQT